MANKKSIAAGIFFLIHAVAFFVYMNVLGISFADLGDSIYATFFKGYLFITILGAVMYFIQAFIPAAIIAFVSGIALCLNGVEAYSILKDGFGYTTDLDLMLVSFIVFAASAGIAYIFLGIVLLVNRKKQNTTGLAALPIIFMVIAAVPFMIEYARIAFTKATLPNELTVPLFLSKKTEGFIIMAVYSVAAVVATIFASLSFKFKGRKVSHYRPMDENLGALTGENGEESSSFYQPFGNNSGRKKFYDPREATSAAPSAEQLGTTESVLSSRGHVAESGATESPLPVRGHVAESGTIKVNETNFTATKDDYVEHQFNTSSPTDTVVFQRAEQPEQNAEEMTDEQRIAELTKFKQLLDAGVISQEEFDTQKKKLLGI